MNIACLFLGMAIGGLTGFMISAMLTISKRWSEMEDAYEEEKRNDKSKRE